MVYIVYYNVTIMVERTTRLNTYLFNVVFRINIQGALRKYVQRFKRKKLNNKNLQITDNFR